MSSLIELSEKEERLATRVDQTIADNVDVAGGLRFSNAGQVMEFAKMMAVSNIGVRKHLRGNPGACLAVVVQALEWKMSPYAVASKSYLVNDQIAWESQLVQAVILQRAPIKGRIRFRFEGEGGKRKCIASATLADGTGDVDYESPEFDKIQPKNSPLWKSNPDQQHCYHSGISLCRRHFPDVILGVYAEDEFEREPAVGPDRARDITPPRTLGAKLDALVAGAAEPAHDPDTGEIKDANGKPEDSATAPQNEDSGEGGADVAPQNTASNDAGKRDIADEGPDKLAIARARGREARAKKMSIKAVPPEYREDGRLDEATAWKEGHAEIDQAQLEDNVVEA